MKLKIKNYLFIFYLLFTVSAFANTVAIIHNPPYTSIDQQPGIIRYLIEEIYKELDLKVTFVEVDHNEAMQMIDDNEFFIAAPYYRPVRMSNRILLSKPLYTLETRIFYNKRLYRDLEVNQLADLQTYIVGSNAFYEYEAELRKAGLTVHYSKDNIESMQKLTDQQVAFVVEEKIKGLNYLRQSSGSQKENIDFYDISLFEKPVYICAPANNPNAVELIEKINKLLENHEFVTNAERRYIELHLQ